MDPQPGSGHLCARWRSGSFGAPRAFFQVYGFRLLKRAATAVHSPFDILCTFFMCRTKHAELTSFPHLITGHVFLTRLLLYVLGTEKRTMKINALKRLKSQNFEDSI